MQPKPTDALRRTSPNTAAVEPIRSAATPFPASGGAPETAPAGAQASEIQPDQIHVPPDWVKGQLLNVRNKGEYYAVTLLGEEEDPRHPDRALRFTNPARCQDFVSKWYAREHFDPRAW